MTKNILYYCVDDENYAKEMSFLHNGGKTYLDVLIDTPFISDVEVFRGEDLVKDISEVYKKTVNKRYAWCHHKNKDKINDVWSPFSLSRVKTNGDRYEISYSYDLPLEIVYDMGETENSCKGCFHAGFYSQKDMDRVCVEIANIFRSHFTSRLVDVEFRERYEIDDLMNNRMFNEDVAEIVKMRDDGNVLLRYAGGE